MIEILIVTLVILSILLELFLFKKINFLINLLNKPEEKKPKLLDELKIEPLLDDVMRYTFDKNLKCTIKPNNKNKISLFYYDEANKSDLCITELFTTEAKRGTHSYNKAFEEIKTKIDTFIMILGEKNAKT